MCFLFIGIFLLFYGAKQERAAPFLRAGSTKSLNFPHFRRRPSADIINQTGCLREGAVSHHNKERGEKLC